MLPIGSIVYLNDGSRKIMILNRGPLVVIDEKTQMFDYSGCIYPVGLVQDQVLYFNQENIDRIIFEGFADDDEARFQEMYFKWIQENANELKKGQVNKPLSV
jgi:hypothetical protein